MALHRDVEGLDRILSEAVEERLRESTTIAEIPGELAHANEAKFARAFRRWTGESSSARRRRSRIYQGPPR